MALSDNNGPRDISDVNKVSDTRPIVRERKGIACRRSIHRDDAIDSKTNSIDMGS